LNEEEAAQLYNEASTGINQDTACFGNTVLLEWERASPSLSMTTPLPVGASQYRKKWCLIIVLTGSQGSTSGCPRRGCSETTPCPLPKQAKFKNFHKKHAPFEREYKWNSQMAQKGQSWRWHEEHSLNYTVVFGFVACCVCSKTFGIGPCEHSWGNVKKYQDRKEIASKW
jgi:hypothetical protein